MDIKSKSPQKEEGYTAINNENLDYLLTQNFSGRELRIILVIIRKTWGFNKKKDEISLTQFEKATKIDRSNISRILNSLIKRCVVKVDNTPIKTYWFNKQYYEWDFIIKNKKTVNNLKPVVKNDNEVLSKTTKGVVKIDNKSVVKVDKHKRHKDNITKDTYTKDKTDALFNLFKEINPSYEILPKLKKEKEALCRLLDKYGYDELFKMFQELPKIVTIFTAPRITSPFEFELKSGQLKIFIAQQKNKGNKFSVTQL